MEGLNVYNWSAILYPYVYPCFLYTLESYSTPPSDIPDPENNQPHIVFVAHDEYNQYYVAVEKLCA